MAETVVEVALPFAQCAITDVTVFNDRAQVTRRVEYAASETRVVKLKLEDLTSSVMQRDNIRVKGTGHVTLLDVSVVDLFEEKEPAHVIEAIEGDIHDAEKQKTLLKTKVEIARREEGLLSTLVEYQFKPSSNGACLPAPNVDAALTTLDMFVVRNEQIQSRLLELESSLASLEEKLVSSRDRLFIAKSRTKKTHVVVSIRPHEPGNITLDVRVNRCGL